jgi:hypothetical protein
MKIWVQGLWGTIFKGLNGYSAFNFMRLFIEGINTDPVA